MKPLILINFKTYPNAIGNKGILLAKKIAAVKTKKYDIAIAPSIMALRDVCHAMRIPVFAQHVDKDVYGAHTGHILAAEVKEAGAIGTILNHSEKKVLFAELKRIVNTCKIVELKTVICASTLAEVKKIAELKPDFIAYEPAELIGGSVSVTMARPEVIGNAVKSIQKISPKTRMLCGAGVHSNRDVQMALKLGASGVLLAHAIVTVREPRKALEKMVL